MLIEGEAGEEGPGVPPFLGSEFANWGKMSLGF